MWIIQRKHINKFYTLRGHSSHSSLHVFSISFVSSPIVGVGGHPETGHNLTGIDRSSSNATHTPKRQEMQRRGDLFTS